MKKIVITNGIIAGIISTSWIIAFLTLGKSIDFDKGMLYGFGSMILAFSLIFVGVKNYRDKYNNGLISFGKAFMIGLYISLIASTIYVFAWQIDFFFFYPEFTEEYTTYELNTLRAKGASELEISKKTKEMAEFAVDYRRPWYNILVTYSEILPVGILISLICASIMRRKGVNKTEMVFSS